MHVLEPSANVASVAVRTVKDLPGARTIQKRSPVRVNLYAGGRD